MFLDQLQIHWVWFALLAMLFAGMAPVLAKAGLKYTSEASAAALALCVLVFFAWSGYMTTTTSLVLTGFGFRNYLILLIGGIISGVAVLCFTSALNQIGVHEAVPFQKLVLVLTLLYGIVVEKSMVSTVVMVAMVLVVVGIILLAVDSSNRGGLMMAVLFAVLLTILHVLDQMFPTTIDAGLVYPIRITIACIVCWLMVIFSKGSKEWKKITLYSALMCLLAGCSYCLSTIAYARALGVGEPTVVGPLYNCSIMVAVMCAVLFLKEKVGRKGVIGLVCILIGMFVL